MPALFDQFGIHQGNQLNLQICCGKVGVLHQSGDTRLVHGVFGHWYRCMLPRSRAPWGTTNQRPSGKRHTLSGLGR